MYNVHAQYLSGEQKYALKQHLLRINPAMVLILDDLHYAIEIKRALPDTAVIFRRYHPSNNGGDDNVHMKLTPQQWLEGYADTPKDLMLYAGNEPGISQALFDWTLEACKLTIAAGRKAVVLNFSVGVPEKTDWIKADPLLRFIGQHRNSIYVGLHEYSASLWSYEFAGASAILPNQWPTKITGSSWLLGRYRALLDYCRMKSIPTPRIAITEHGWDGIAAAADFQRNLRHANTCDGAGAMWCNVPQWEEWTRGTGMSWQKYAYLQIQAGWNALYRHDKEIVGFALFSYGGQGRWQLYDVKDATEFIGLMEQGNWTMTTNTTPQPSGLRWVVNMNVRAQPSIKAALVGNGIKAGTPAQIVSTATADGYLWTEVSGGYAAYVNLKTRESYVGV